MSLLERFLSFDEPTSDVRGDYDVYAQSLPVGEWRLIYRVRPQDDGGLIVDWVQS